MGSATPSPPSCKKTGPPGWKKVSFTKYLYEKIISYILISINVHEQCFYALVGWELTAAQVTGSNLVHIVNEQYHTCFHVLSSLGSKWFNFCVNHWSASGGSDVRTCCLPVCLIWPRRPCLVHGRPRKNVGPDWQMTNNRHCNIAKNRIDSFISSIASLWTAHKLI